MPELPEVETVARYLDGPLRGRVVRAAAVLDAKLQLNLRKLSGHTVRRVFRTGKLVVLELSMRKKSRYLAVHLRMTGRLTLLDDDRSYGRFVHPQQETEKHLRAKLIFDRGSLGFFDTRRFGTMEIYDSLEALPVRGIEPLSDRCTAARLGELLKTAKQPLKPWLLRQDRLVGIGNIYASEILHLAKLSPRRRASTLSGAEVSRLYEAIRAVLDEAIRHCGTTVSDFQTPLGAEGGFQSFLAVYEREGEPCRRCRAPIRRFVQAQRSTYFCPGCQRQGASKRSRRT